MEKNSLHHWITIKSRENFYGVASTYPVKANNPLLSYYSGSHLYVITQTQLRSCFANLILKLNVNKNFNFHSLQLRVRLWHLHPVCSFRPFKHMVRGHWMHFGRILITRPETTTLQLYFLLYIVVNFSLVVELVSNTLCILSFSKSI
jgi:hypothetical protein